MPQLNPRTYADAKQLGDQLYELVLSNWGNRGGAAADKNNGSIINPAVAGAPGSGIIPPVPFPNGIADTLVRGQPLPSIAAIAISPRSTVDRCVLQFENLPQNTKQLVYVSSRATDVTDPNVIRDGGMLETEMLLVPGAPYVGMLNGPVVVRASSDHWFTDAYNLDGAPLASSTATFGTALGLPAPDVAAQGGPPIWIDPELRLLVWLTNKPSPCPPLARAPLRVSFGAYPRADPAPGADVLVRCVPIMGRRHVSIALFTSGFSGEATFTFKGVTSTIVRGNLQNNEVDLDIAPVTVGGGGNTGSALVTFTNEAPAVSWLTVYAQHSGGLNPVDSTVTIEAIDR